jgi:hypothetical protein
MHIRFQMDRGSTSLPCHDLMSDWSSSALPALGTGMRERDARGVTRGSCRAHGARGVVGGSQRPASRGLPIQRL